MLGMERHTAEAPYEFNSSETRSQREAFSGLPRFPTLQRLVRLLLGVYRNARVEGFTGTLKGVNSFSTVHVKMQVFIMVMYSERDTLPTWVSATRCAKKVFPYPEVETIG